MMPTTYLTDMIAAIRVDLHDTEATAYLWSDAVLTRHIAHALAEYSAANPLAATTTITAIADIYAYSLTSIAALSARPNAIFAVECPYLATTPAYLASLVPFRVWADTLYLLTSTAPATGDVLRIWYYAPHTLTEDTKTYPSDDDPWLQLGAAAHAALDRQIYASERITVNAQTASLYESWGNRAMQRWLDELAYRRRSHGQYLDTRQPIDTTDI